MNWNLQCGKENDVVFSNKIVLYRNLRNYRFGNKDAVEIENLVKEKLPIIGYGLRFLKLKDMDEITKKALLERGIISSEFIKDENEIHSILINDDENICIMINGSNHLEMQFFSSGMDLKNLFNLAKEIDEKINETFDIAKSQKYGYLTTSPVDLGTGMRVITEVHLPALTRTGNIKKLGQIVNSFGININGKYTDGANIIGDIYRIFNKQTLGITEEDIIKNELVIIEKVIEQERDARKILGKNAIELEDIVYRSYGILTNARKLSFEEAIKLLSDVKMGIDMGVIKEANDPKARKIYYYINPANLQKYVGKNLERYEQSIKRAETIRSIVFKE